MCFYFPMKSTEREMRRCSQRRFTMPFDTAKTRICWMLHFQYIRWFLWSHIPISSLNVRDNSSMSKISKSNEHYHYINFPDFLRVNKTEWRFESKWMELKQFYEQVEYVLFHFPRGKKKKLANSVHKIDENKLLDVCTIWR